MAATRTVMVKSCGIWHTLIVFNRSYVSATNGSKLEVHLYMQEFHAISAILDFMKKLLIRFYKLFQSSPTLVQMIFRRSLKKVII